MDGDLCPLQEIVALTKKYHAHLIIDEAHATGIIGEKGEGLVQWLGSEREIFARIHTFGKACGCHGAVVLGSQNLCSYLINFSRSFIYTTALPPASVHAIIKSYNLFPSMRNERIAVNELAHLFKKKEMKYEKVSSNTPIQGVIVPGNEEVKEVANRLQASGFDVRPILYPTVPKGKERLRIVIHSFNTAEHVEGLVGLLV